MHQQPDGRRSTRPTTTRSLPTPTPPSRRVTSPFPGRSIPVRTPPFPGRRSRASRCARSSAEILAQRAGSAFAGSVAPIRVRHFLIASVPPARARSGSRGHEAGQAGEERPLAVHGVKTLRLRFGQVDLTDGTNLESGLLDALKNLPACLAATASGLMIANVRSAYPTNYIDCFCQTAYGNRDARVPERYGGTTHDRHVEAVSSAQWLGPARRRRRGRSVIRSCNRATPMLRRSTRTACRPTTTKIAEDVLGANLDETQG